MVNETEYCANEVSGTWTNNANAWNGSDVDAASTSTGAAQTSGNITGNVFSDMGDGDSILGIEVLVVADGDGGDTCRVELYKPSDSGYIAQTYSFAPGSKATYTVGAADNLWGETWGAAADIKQALFGVRLQYDNVGKADTMSVYTVAIRVTYTAPQTYAVKLTQGLQVDDSVLKVGNGTDFVFVILSKTVDDAGISKYTLADHSVDWATVHADVSASQYNQYQHRINANWDSGYSEYYIGRGPILFDTSVIPADHAIMAATLGLYVTYVSDLNLKGNQTALLIHDSGDVHPADPPVSADFDFANYDNSAGESASFDDTIQVGDLLTITLNAYGRSSIVKAGLSRWILMCGLDWTNTEPTDGVDECYLSFYTRNASGRSPRIEILTHGPTTYAVGLTEGLSFTDTLLRRMVKRVQSGFSILSDVTVSGGMVLKTIVRELGISITETIRVPRTWLTQLAEGLSITDYFSRVTSTLRQLAEGISVQGTASVRAVIARTFTQGFSIVGTWSKRQVMHRTITQGFSITDYFTRTIPHLKALAESLTVAPILIKDIRKRLGVSHLYMLWDKLLWAADGETDAGATDWKDVARNGTTYKATLLTNGGDISPGDVADGRFGAATHFDEAHDEQARIENSNTAVFTLDAFTVAIWVRFTDLAHTYTVLRRNGDSNIDKWLMTVSSSNVYFYIRGSTGINYWAYKSGVNLNDGEWHLLLGTYNKSEGKVRLSIDGGTFASSATYTGDLWSGNGYIYVGYSAYYIHGDVDDFMFFNDSLSQAEVTDLFNAGRGLNLNQLNDNKGFWGPSFADTVTEKNYKPFTTLTQGFSVSASLLKRRFAKAITMSLSITDTLSVLITAWYRFLTESLSVAETFNRVHDAKRFFTQELSVVAAPGWRRGITRRLTQGITFVSDVLSKGFFSRRLTQGISFASSVFKSQPVHITEQLSLAVTMGRRYFSRKLTDSLSVSDGMLRRTVMARYVAESFAIDATVSFRGALVRSLTQGLTILDTLTKKIAMHRGLTQGLAFADTLAKNVRWLRKLPQGISFDATAEFTGNWYKKFAQGLSFVATPTLTKLGVLSKVIADGFSVVVSLSKEIDMTRTLAQGLAFVATFSKSHGWVKRFTQGASIEATVGSRGDWYRKFSQSVSIEIISSQVRSGVLSIIQGLAFVDTLTQRNRWVRSITQGVAFEATVQFTGDWYRLLVQGITVVATPVITKLGLLTRTITQGLSMAASLTVGGRWIRSFTETVSIAATPSTVKAMVKAIVDGFAVIGDVATRSFFRRVRTEGFTVGDTVEKRSGWYRTLSDGISLAAETVKRLSHVRAIAESFSLVADVMKRQVWKVLHQGVVFYVVGEISGAGFYVKKLVQSLSMMVTVGFAGSSYVRSITQGFSVSGDVLKRFVMRLESGLSVTGTALASGTWIRTITEAVTIGVISPSMSVVKAIVSGFTVVGDVLTRGFFRKAHTDGFTVDDTLVKRSTWHRTLADGFSIVDTLLKDVRKRIAQGFSTATSVVFLKVLWLTQSLTVGDILSKGIRKRLGVNHLYTIWDALRWAWDAETNINAATSGGGAVALYGSPAPTLGGISGKHGLATHFDAASDQIGTIGNYTPFNYTDLLSVAFWLKIPVSGSMPGYVLTKPNNASTDPGDYNHVWAFYYSDIARNIGLDVNSAAGWVTTAGHSITRGVWHLIVAHYSQTDGKLRISIDGGAYSENDYSSPLAQTSAQTYVAIANQHWTMNEMTVSLDDIMAFSRPLTVAEAKALHDARVGLNLNNYTDDKTFWGIGFTDSVEAKISALGLILYEGIAFSTSLVQRMGLRLAQGFSVAEEIMRRNLWRRMTQPIPVHVAVTSVSGKLFLYLSQSLTVAVTTLKSFGRRLSDGASITADVSTSIGQIVSKILTESFSVIADHMNRFSRAMSLSLSFSDGIGKGLHKRLGTSHLFALWDSIVDAWDMETATDWWKCKSAAGTTAVLTTSGTWPCTIGDVSGKYGNATSFDSAYIQSAIRLTVDPGVSDGAVMAWVKVASSLSGIVAARNRVSPFPMRLSWKLWLDSGVPKFTTIDKNGASVTATASGTISNDEWHLLVGTWSVPDGLIKLSVDGSAFDTAVLADELDALGSNDHYDFMGNYNDQTECLTGHLDDPVVFDRMLTIDEVYTLYRARRGLNLNVQNDDKPFWGPGFTDSVTKSRTYAYAIEQGISFVATFSRRIVMHRFVTDGFAVADRLKKSAGLVLHQGATFSENLIRGSVKSLEASFSIYGSPNKTLYRVITDGIAISDTIKRAKWTVLALVESFTVRETWNRIHDAVRKFTQSIRLTDILIADVEFTILAITPLAGTFPRPARVATFTLKVSRKSTGDALPDCAVTVLIKDPDGVAWKTLTLIESTHTAGLYSVNFRILGSDKVGTYPFTATARYGKLSTGTYSGFVTVFQGPYASIHFR